MRSILPCTSSPTLDFDCADQWCALLKVGSLPPSLRWILDRVSRSPSEDFLLAYPSQNSKPLLAKNGCRAITRSIGYTMCRAKYRQSKSVACGYPSVWLFVTKSSVNQAPSYFNSISKPSKPSCAYLKLSRPSYLSQLEDKVSNTCFRDKTISAGDTSLIAPPVVELSPYPKTPCVRQRVDPRQGSIEKDPEFIAFLDALANPAPHTNNNNNSNNNASNGPSVQVSEAPAPLPRLPGSRTKKEKSTSVWDTKNSRRFPGSSKSKTEDTIESRTTDATKHPGNKKKKGLRHDEGISILTRSSPRSEFQPGHANEKPGMSSLDRGCRSMVGQSLDGTASERQSKLAMGARSAANKHGSTTFDSPGSKRTKNSTDPLSATASTQGDGSSGRPAITGTESKNRSGTHQKPRLADGQQGGHPAGPVDRLSLQSKQKGRGGQVGGSQMGLFKSMPPKILKKNSIEEHEHAGEVGSIPCQSSHSSPVLQPVPQTSTEPLTTGFGGIKDPGNSHASRQGFIKNVAASQGINSSSLTEALSPFGQVMNIEIERRKSHAYVEFAEPESLASAVKASPIKCGKGTIAIAVRRPKQAVSSVSAETETASLNAGGSVPGSSAASVNLGRPTEGRTRNPGRPVPKSKSAQPGIRDRKPVVASRGGKAPLSLKDSTDGTLATSTAGDGAPPLLSASTPMSPEPLGNTAVHHEPIMLTPTRGDEPDSKDRRARRSTPSNKPPSGRSRRARGAGAPAGAPAQSTTDLDPASR